MVQFVHYPITTIITYATQLALARQVDTTYDMPVVWPDLLMAERKANDFSTRGIEAQRKPSEKQLIVDLAHVHSINNH